jgi:hypothetical protein
MKTDNLLARFHVFLKGKTGGFPNWIILVLVLCGVIGNCQSPNNTVTNPETKPTPTPVIQASPEPSPIQTPIKPVKPATKLHESEVRVICKNLAESHAISPIGVKHSLTKPEYVESTGMWIYRGHMDSQNAFGAMMRNNYNCGVMDETEQAVIEFVAR